jgi:hypothetical protein
MVAAMSSLASEAAQLARLSPRQRDVLEAFPDGCLDTTAGGAARHELLDLPGPSRSCNQRSVRLSGGRWWPGSRVERVLGHVMRSPYTSRFIGARNAKGGAHTMRVHLRGGVSPAPNDLRHPRRLPGPRWRAQPNSRRMRPGRSRPPNGARQAEAAAIGNAEGSVGASDVVPDLGDGTGMPVVATPVTGFASCGRLERGRDEARTMVGRLAGSPRRGAGRFV